MRTGYAKYLTFENVAILAILLLASYLRLFHISQYMTFLGDEGRDMLVVKRMIVDHKFTLLGPTASVGGFFLGPIYYYFMLPFVWAARMDPVGAAVMVALFGIATVYLLYRTGRSLFDAWVGLMAAALYALSPMVIAYSRSSWNPNLVPFFATLVIYLLWQATHIPRPKFLFWVGVALGIGLQLHYLFLFMFPVVFVWTALLRPDKSWIRYMAMGVAGFLIGYGPFLAFELRHGFPNTQAIFRFLLAGKETGLAGGNYFTIVTDVAYRLFGRVFLRLPPPEQMGNYIPAVRLLWDIGTKFAIFTSLGVVLMHALDKLPGPYSGRKGTSKLMTPYVLILLWFAIPVLLFGLYKKGIYDYYFGLLFPVPFLMAAVVGRTLSRGAMGKFAAVLAFAGLAFLNWQGRPFRYPPNNQLAQAKLIAEAALTKTGGKPFNFALMANFNSDHAYRYFFEIWNRAPVTIENEAIDPERRTVTGQLIVICELSDCKPLGNSLWEIAGFGRAEIDGQWDVSFVKIFRLVHYRPADESRVDIAR